MPPIKLHRTSLQLLAPERCAHNAPCRKLVASAAIAVLTGTAHAQLQFQDLARLTTGNFAAARCAHGDVDSDGDIDVIFAINGARAQLHLNDGSGRFEDATAPNMPVIPPLGSVHDRVALADVDNDGDLDMVLGGRASLHLYLNDGSGTFSDVTASQLPSVLSTAMMTDMQMADVDGDGDLDLMLGTGDVYDDIGHRNRLYINNGAGVFADATTAQMPNVADNTRSIDFGDIDGDGDLDMVCGNAGYYSGEQNRLYLNNGAGIFTDATATALPVDDVNTNELVLGDIDGDGDLDVVCANSEGGSLYGQGAQNTIYLNNGAGVFVDATPTLLPVAVDYTVSVALGDVDEDGQLDIVFGSTSWQGQRLYLSSTGIPLTDVGATRLPQGDTLSFTELHDLDGDGDLDLLTGTSNSQPSGRMLTNLQRQLHAAQAPQLGQAFSIEAYARYGPAALADIAIPYLSTVAASLPTPGVGTLHLDPNHLVPLPPLVIPQATGVGCSTIIIPNAATLIGTTVYCQSLLVAWPLSMQLSNQTIDVIMQ